MAQLGKVIEAWCGNIGAGDPFWSSSTERLEGLFLTVAPVNPTMQDIHDKSADEKNAMDAEFNTVEIEDSDQDHKTLELFDTVDPVYQAKARILNHAIQEIGMGKYQVNTGLRLSHTNMH